jgi:hypothetical protein
VSDPKPVEIVIPPELSEFGELVRKTEMSEPNPQDILALRRYLDEHREVWRVLGDLSEFAYTRLVDAAVGDHLALRESLKTGRLAMRQDLGYEEASALERLLIDQVVLCWLRMSHVEFNHTAISNRDTPLSVRDHWERKLSATQRRYLRACETLARVRRLRLPSLQINVGDRQVNVAGGL